MPACVGNELDYSLVKIRTAGGFDGNKCLGKISNNIACALHGQWKISGHGQTYPITKIPNY